MLDLTAFVLSVGQKTAGACLEALDKQDCKFNVELIENVSPLNEAMQRMLDLARTTYFVQVDADMILYPHAIQRLYATIQEQRLEEPKLAMVALPLFDVHMAMPIIGVKIYLTQAAASHPFTEGMGCDVAHAAGMAEKGWLSNPILETECVGEHGVEYTAFEAFERYRELMEKQRRFGHSPFVEKLLSHFIARANHDETDLWAALGLVAGLAVDISRPAKNKDARLYGENDPTFRKLKEMIDGGRL